MEITVKVFGQLAELLSSSQLEFEEVTDTDELIHQLQQKFPAFRSATYAIAVNKKMISGNTILYHGNTVALLPPFSGG